MIRIKRKRKHNPRFFLMGALVLLAAVVISFPLMYWLYGGNFTRQGHFTVLESAVEHRQLAEEYAGRFNWVFSIPDVGALTYHRLDMDSDEIYALLRRADDDVDGLYFDVVMRRVRDDIHPVSGNNSRVPSNISWRLPLPDEISVQPFPRRVISKDGQRSIYRRYWMARAGDALYVERSIPYRDLETPALEMVHWLLGRRVTESHPRVEFNARGRPRLLHSVDVHEASLRKPYPDSFYDLTPLYLGRGGGVHEGWSLTAYETLEEPNLLMVEIGRETYPTQEIYRPEDLTPGLRRYWLDRSKGYAWVCSLETFHYYHLTGRSLVHHAVISDDFEQVESGVWAPRRRVLLESRSAPHWSILEEIVVLDMGVAEGEGERTARIIEEAAREAGHYENGRFIRKPDPTPTPSPRSYALLDENDPAPLDQADTRIVEALNETPPDYGLDELTYAPYEGCTQALLDELMRRDEEMLRWTLHFTTITHVYHVYSVPAEGGLPVQLIRDDVHESSGKLELRPNSDMTVLLLPQNYGSCGFGLFSDNPSSLSFTPDRATVLSQGWIHLNAVHQNQNYITEAMLNTLLQFGRGVTLLTNRFARAMQARENPDVVLLEAYPAVHTFGDVYRFWLDRSKGYVWLRMEHDFWHLGVSGYGAGTLEKTATNAFDYRRVEGQWIPHWVRIETFQSAEGERETPVRIQNNRVEEILLNVDE